MVIGSRHSGGGLSSRIVDSVDSVDSVRELSSLCLDDVGDEM